MRSKSNLDSFRNVRRIAFRVGLLSALPVALFVKSYPWLIAIPVIFGSIFVVIVDFSPGVVEALPRFIISLLGVKDFRPDFLPREVQSQPLEVAISRINYSSMLPSRPAAIIDSQQEVMANLASAVMSERKIKLRGETGSGKSTIALEFCRMWAEKDEGGSVTKKPIVMQFSQTPPRTNGISNLIIDMVAEKIVPSGSLARQHIARKMLQEGSLCLILDDLDFLNRNDLTALDKYARKRAKNSFVCMVNDDFDPDFLKGFEQISVPPWTRKDVLAFINDQIEDATRKNELITFLKGRNELDKQRTPIEWSYIVDSTLEGHLFKDLYPNLESKTSYQLLDTFLAILVGGKSLYNDYIKDLGKLSLRLLKQSRKTFTLNQPETEGLQLPLEKLAPKLFEASGNGGFTMHGTRQVFMASKYLATFWPEAKADLMDSAAKSLIWTPVYRCTRELMAQEYWADLDQTFLALGKITKKSLATEK